MTEEELINFVQLKLLAREAEHKAEVERLREALEQICNKAPLNPVFDSDYLDDLEHYAADSQHYKLAQIARNALEKK
jgi:hypothetical protein